MGVISNGGKGKQREGTMKKLIGYSTGQLEKMLDGALSIDNSSDFALDEAMKEHSKMHGKWSALSAKAQKFYRLKEMEMKKVTAECISRIRKKYAADGVKLAQTYPIEKELVPLEEEWQEAMQELIEMEEYVNLLSSVERAFNNRAWLLIRLARNREGSFEPDVKGRKRGASGPVEMEEYEL